MNRVKNYSWRLTRKILVIYALERALHCYHTKDISFLMENEYYLLPEKYLKVILKDITFKHTPHHMGIHAKTGEVTFFYNFNKKIKKIKKSIN